jgi:hypothetical protein
MENKVINLKINSNFQEAEQQVKSLGTAIKSLDTETTNLDATFEEVYGDLKPLTARMGEAEDRLYELAKAGKQNTQEYKDLLKSVGEYKKVQQQTDMVVDAAAQTMRNKLAGSINAVAGGFSLVQGSMGLFGVESGKVEEAMLRVQSAMAISQGIETINQGSKSVTALGTSLQKYSVVQKIVTAGQKLWNLAISANPIGLLVVAVTALIAGGVALFNYFKSSSAATAANTKAVDDNKKALESQTKTLERNSNEFSKKQSQELAMAKASGASAAAIRTLELKLIDEKVAYEKSARAIAFNTYEKNKNKLASLQASNADADIIKSQQETTNKSIEEYNKQNQNVQKAFDERKAIQNRHQVEIRQSQTDHLKEVQTKSNDASKKAKEDAEAEAKRLKEEAAKEVIAQAEKFRNELEEAEKVEREARKANADALLTEQQLAIENERLAYEAKLQNARSFGLSTEELEIQHLNNINNINLEAQAKQYATDEENNKKKLEQEKALADGKKAIQEQTIATVESGLNLLKNIFAGNEDVQKGIIIAESAVGIAKMIIANNIANVAALATPQAIATSGVSAIPVIALNNISTGIGIAANIAATSKALSSLGGGSAPSPGSVGGGGGGAAASTPPQFNVVGASSTNQLAQTIGNQQGAPIQAYVVSNDVTTAQALNRNIIRGASL